MKVYIKNMVCKGTRFFVQHELEKLGINWDSLELGEVDVIDNVTLAQIKKLDASLRKYGLEIIMKKSRLVTKVQEAVNTLIETKEKPESGFADFISKRAGHNYAYLNTNFLKETGMPIEEYFIEKKSEKLSLIEETWKDTFTRFGIGA